MSKEFIFEKTVYLSDTNAFGNAYFAKYFEWQGMAREAFFREIMPDPMYLMKTGLKIITVRAATEYKNEVFLYDDLIKGVKIGAVKQASADLIFNFRRKKDNKAVALGYQTIAFADKDDKLIQIPQEIMETCRPYVDEVKYVIGKLFQR